MNNEIKQVKWYNRLFAILGIVLIVFFGVISGFKLGQAYMQEQEPKVTAAAMTINGTEYDWVFDSFVTMGSNATYMWSDGVDLYYSYTDTQLVYDADTHTWSDITWYGFTQLQGIYVWFDGTTCHYDAGSSGHYVLDVSTHTWTSVAWTGYTSIRGDRVWSDGVNFYYSYNTNQYVLDVTNFTATAMTWSGITQLNGAYVWFDGTTYRYSNSTNQYILDVSTHTWSAVTYTNLIQPRGDRFHSFNGNVYYSYGDEQYILDTSSNVATSDTSFCIPRSDGSYYFDFDGTSYYMNSAMFSFSPVDNNGGGGQPIYPGNDNTATTFLSNSISINTYNLKSYGFEFMPNRNAYFYFTCDESNLTNVNSPNYEKLVIDFDFMAYIRFTDSNGDPINNNYQLAHFTCHYAIDTTQAYSNGLNYTLTDYWLTCTETGYTDRKIAIWFATNDLDNVSFATATFSSIVGNGTPLDYYNQSGYYYEDLLLSNGSKYFDIRFMRDLAYTSGLEDRNYFGWSSVGSPRIYYLRSNFDNNEFYNSGYTQGYEDGYSAGEVDGGADGYQDGYHDGYNVGMRVGYTNGQNDANQYTFINLIGATIDAPISAFRGLFNFSVFGVNMTDFLTALFSITLVIVILKFVLVK